jgi:thiamine kinase-like enzyme
MDIAASPDLALSRVHRLPCWRGPITVEPLGGGLSNRNYKVADADGAWVVRVAGEVPEHGIVRANDIAASRAAAAAGIAPELRHAETDVLVIRFVDGRPLTEADVQTPSTRTRIAELLRRTHNQVGRHLRGPAIMFWVFHALRDYAAQLRQTPDGDDLPRLMTIAEALETAIGAIDLVFGHNDLLPANLIDDGSRLWLIDWEYAGYNSPLFDLANLASNAGLDESAWRDLLADYHDRVPDEALLRSAGAMRVASLLREALWARVARRHQRVSFDFHAYSVEYLGRFDAAHRAFLEAFR